MDRLAQVCDAVAAHNSRLSKVALLSEYLRGLDDADLARAVRFLTGRPFAASDRRRLSVGGATLREAVQAVAPWPPEILRVCYREVGDMGEAIGLILTGLTRNEPLTLERAEELYEALQESRKAAEKVAIVRRCFATYRPPALKYFVKAITGDLRIGLQEKTLEEAVSQSTSIPLAEIRAANNSSGDLGQVALAARRGLLHEIEAALFHPMDFMLAKPLDSLENLPDPETWAVEDKYDGIRAQIHLENGRSRIYTRGLEDLTDSFPELQTAIRAVHGSAVFDGEILAWRDGRALPFNLLQQRLSRKKIPASMLAGIPVAFVAYDVLYRNGQLLIDKPLEFRRSVLETAFRGNHQHLQLSAIRTATSVEDVDRLFRESRGRGNEGLVLKRRGSLYEPGKRGGEWLKVKRPYGTLDVVITAAEQGHGRRATVLSDYTFAVRTDEGKYVNVGKAYSGLSDEEIRELTRILRASSTERFGRVYLVRPEVVLEVAFDGVQKSSRHKSGYALRFPRIVRWRRDKKPEEADGLARVRSLYEASLVVGGAPEVW